MHASLKLDVSMPLLIQQMGQEALCFWVFCPYICTCVPGWRYSLTGLIGLKDGQPENIIPCPSYRTSAGKITSESLVLYFLTTDQTRFRCRVDSRHREPRVLLALTAATPAPSISISLPANQDRTTVENSCEKSPRPL